MYQATVDSEYIIELGACLSMFSEMELQFREASALISEYEEEMGVILISEAEGSTGIVEKKKGFFKKIVDIMKSIWKGLCNIIRRIMQLLAKPFYLLFGVRDKKKVDIPEGEDRTEEGFVRTFKRVGGLTEGLSQVFEMKEMGDTGIEELFQVDKMYQTLIGIAEDGEILNEIKKDNISSPETTRRKKEMINDDILDEEGSVNKDSFVRISEKHKETMKSILEFSNIMKKMITTEVIDFNTTHIKTAEEIEAELVETLETLSNSHLGNKFKSYMDARSSKYIHALRDFANDKSDVVTGMKLNVDNTSFSGREALYYAQIEIVASLLETSTVSDEAIYKLEEVIASPMSSYDKSFTNKLSGVTTKLKTELNNISDEVGLMKAIGTAKELVEVIASNNNRKEAFTMTRQNKNIVMDKKDIFKAIDYSVIVESVQLQKVTGALNAMFTSIESDNIGKRLNLFDDSFVKDTANTFKNDYLKPIVALSESIADDMSKVNIISGDNTPLKSKSGNTRPTKEKQLKAARFNTKEDSAKLNAIVAEATRTILTGMKEDVSVIMNQVIDMEKHIRLCRISRINAAMTMYISYFTNLLLAENEYILAMKDIESNTNDDVIKSMYFDAVKYRKIQYSKFKI